METKSVAKSCTPPMRIEPATIQTRAGSQPKAVAAMIGPTIGPAPAIDEKWWPRRTARLAGTRSTPS